MMLGERLRALRVASGLTQEQLAQAIGLQQPQVSAIEVGRRETTTAVLQRWVEVCGGELHLRATKQSSTSALIDATLNVVDPGLAPEAMALVRAWAQLSAGKRSAISLMVAAMAEDRDRG